MTVRYDSDECQREIRGLVVQLLKRNGGIKHIAGRLSEHIGKEIPHQRLCHALHLDPAKRYRNPFDADWILFFLQLDGGEVIAAYLAQLAGCDAVIEVPPSAEERLLARQEAEREHLSPEIRALLDEGEKRCLRAHRGVARVVPRLSAVGDE